MKFRRGTTKLVRPRGFEPLATCSRGRSPRPDFLAARSPDDCVAGNPDFGRGQEAQFTEPLFGRVILQP